MKIMECLSMQTDYMLDLQRKNGNLKHIDATYCFKVENFLFFQSSCQNENLNGVLVAYSSMQSETQKSEKAIQ